MLTDDNHTAARVGTGQPARVAMTGGDTVATSRTGTAEWKNLRRGAIKQARGASQTTCPLCNAWLNWQHSGQPNSPELDHITPHSVGGTNEPHNLRIICRSCNGKRGGQLGRAKQLQAQREANRKPIEATTAFEW